MSYLDMYCEGCNIIFKPYFVKQKYHNQQCYLKSSKNPFRDREITKRGGLSNKGNKRPDLSNRNKEQWYIKLRAEGLKKSPNPNKSKERMRNLNNNKEFQKKRIKGLIKRPTIPEQILINLINNSNLPYKYTGNGEVIIGRKNPDFINYNGQKKIIELFGGYWHLKIKNLNWNRTEFGTTAIYSQYGFKTLIIWENELKDLNKVLEKIKKFDRSD